MNIVICKEMFGNKRFNKGKFTKGNKFLWWVNLWGFGIIISNTCKGFRYDISL